ncbi:hypothetical protein ACOQFV_07540 [Nocardiopsis changdeensis]|uniref:Uncharacterized protein n=1 Tax=Nocardiopsis changdeensis TaxID=2831969 RepID=A0ABX8BEA2_9ACTN|nr:MULTISPECIES: hypothetical protein [Nocardiopsis]QUX20581.1 hypothetical protein KGD84_18930 [Nocardiopsis changdeensis]QYX36512.1 hypothetical protein K1J57_28385 [Nocardiopsis sp. MT53]
MDDSLLLDFDSPNSDDMRFSAAFGAWYMAVMGSQQALANPNINPHEISVGESQWSRQSDLRMGAMEEV